MTPPMMRLCTCGHRMNRHPGLGKDIRGGCLLCSCEVFKDAKSSIEEEIAAPQPYEAVLAAAGRALAAAALPMPAPETSVLPEEVDSDGRGLIEVPPAVATPPADRGRAIAPQPDSSLLGSWDSWWCESCGARRFKAGSCHGSMRPVRVEIHARWP